MQQPTKENGGLAILKLADDAMRNRDKSYLDRQKDAQAIIDGFGGVDKLKSAIELEWFDFVSSEASKEKSKLQEGDIPKIFLGSWLYNLERGFAESAGLRDYPGVGVIFKDATGNGSVHLNILGGFKKAARAVFGAEVWQAMQDMNKPSRPTAVAPSAPRMRG